LSLSEQQGGRLSLKARTQLSPHLERCCLLLSANESYKDTAQDLAVLTGLSVSKSTQQRLVHRQDFPSESVDGGVKEKSIDGGKVRLRTAKGQLSQWRDYKGVNLHQYCVAAFFKANDTLVDWLTSCHWRHR
jgi:hypothetical protein